MIKELRTQHRTIIQMSFNGFKNQEIAERLSMSQSTISNILRSPLAQAYMGGLHDKSKEATLDVRKKLISMNSSALSAFERILEPQTKAPYNVQFSTARDILDRNGFKPTDKVNIDMTLKSKSDQEIDAEINALAKSIALAKSSESNNANKISSDEPTDLLTEPNTTSCEQAEQVAQVAESEEISLNPIEVANLIDELTKTSIDVFPPK